MIILLLGSTGGVVDAGRVFGPPRAPSAAIRRLPPAATVAAAEPVTCVHDLFDSVMGHNDVRMDLEDVTRDEMRGTLITGVKGRQDLARLRSVGCIISVMSVRGADARG